MQYARIANGIVAELFTPPAGLTLAECFHADVATQFFAVPAGVTPGQGWSYSGGTFTAPPAPPPPTLAQQAAAMLVAGCQITSTSTAALDGTYRCDDASRADIMGEVLATVVNGTFADGTTTLEWPDTSGTLHAFSITEFKAFATAIGTYVSALKKIAATNSGTLPAQPVNIA